MKKFYLLFSFGIIIALSFSCEELVVPEYTGKLDTLYSATVDTVYVVSPPDPIYDRVGFGYDVTTNYADVELVKARILDIKKLDSLNYLEIQKIEKAVYKTIEGKSTTEYASNLAIDVGLSGHGWGFSGSLKTNFSQASTSNSEYSYATVQSRINKKLLQVLPEYDNDTLKNYLNPIFKKELNNPNIDPVDLFNKYGTHCMRSIFIGGRIDYNVTIKEELISGTRSLGVYAEASYSGLAFGVSSNVGVFDSVTWSNFNSNVEKSLKVYGGASEFGQHIINSGDYNDWVNSVSDNSVFCDYGKYNALVPIWEFCDDINRAEVIKNSFDEYNSETLEAIKNPENLPSLNIADIIVVRFEKEDKPVDNFYNGDLRYEKLNYNLNEDAGGKIVYLYYAQVLDNVETAGMIDFFYTDPEKKDTLRYGTVQRPAYITDLYIVKDSAKAIYPSLDDVEVMNLNEDAGGKKLYLVKRRDPNAAGRIRGLKLVSAKDKQDSTDVIYTRGANKSMSYFPVTKYDSDWQVQDLNEDAGGDYRIYLYFTRNKY